MLTPSWLGFSVKVSKSLNGGMPTYDIVDGKEVEAGRIHAIKVGDEFLVSQEFFDALSKYDNES